MWWRAAAARRRLLICQNLGGQLPPLPPPLATPLTIRNVSMTFFRVCPSPGSFIPAVILEVSSKSMVILFKAVGRSENPGVPVLFDRHNLPHLVEIGLIGCAMVPPETTGLSHRNLAN